MFVRLSDNFSQVIPERKSIYRYKYIQIQDFNLAFSKIYMHVISKTHLISLLRITKSKKDENSIVKWEK